MWSRAAAWTAAALVTAAPVYHLLTGSRAYLGLFEDDYFYYAIVADNFVATGRATFDGLMPTNGYHPLWFAVLVCLRAVFGRFGPAFYAALAVVSLIGTIATYEIGVRFARQLGAPPWRASVIGCFYICATAILLGSGMEATIAVPLLLLVLVEAASDAPMSVRRAARLGLLCSLAVLARLDVALAVGMLLLGFLIAGGLSLRERVVRLAAFSLGGIVLPAYCAVNYLHFGSPLPVSALAKRLQTGLGFNFTYAERVALGTVFGPTVAVVLPLGALSLLVLLRRRGGISRAWFAGAVAIVFAFTFFGLNALTGWTFFGWYAYPIVPAAIASLAFLCELAWRRTPRAVGVGVGLAITLLAPLSATAYYVQHGPWWSVSDNSLLAMSDELGVRMRNKDGVVAMGAVAGVATYVLDRPVLQLEGIVGDQALLDHIRRQAPLGSVLKEYGARYLVVTLAGDSLERRSNCYVISQPHAEWAGERSAKMQGLLCAEPIEHFFTAAGGRPWSRFSTVETYVWDLHNAAWKMADEQLAN
jgi:hypothetical protein